MNINLLVVILEETEQKENNDLPGFSYLSSNFSTHVNQGVFKRKDTRG